MNCKVFVLASLVLIGSSCKHKSTTENPPTPQETPQPTPPTGDKPQPPHTHESDHDKKKAHRHRHDGDDDDQGEDHDEHHHRKKHHRLPPGQEKKLHGDRSARNYAPGHRKNNGQ